MKGITEAQKASYLNAAKPNCCPLCQSVDVEGGSISIEGKTAIQGCHCTSCEAEWEDHYTLSDVKVYD